MAVAAIDKAAAFEVDGCARGVVRCVDRVCPDVVAAGHGVGSPGRAAVETDLHGDRRFVFQRTVGCGVGDGDRFAVARIGGESRTRGRHDAVVGHPDMLDFRFAHVAQPVRRLDVVIDKFVAKIGQRGIVDLGEVVIGDDGIGPERGVEDKVVDLPVGRGGVERGARLRQDALGHIDCNPTTHFVAAGVGFVLVRIERVDAVVVDADLELHVTVGDAVEVVGVGPDVEPRGHLLEEVAVVDVRLVVEPTEGIPARIVGKPLRLEDGRTGFVLRLAR